MSKKSKSKKPKTIYTVTNEHIDRVAESQTVIDPLRIEILNLDTIILLLKSTENDVILTSLHHLDKFGEKAYENYIKLFENKIVEILLNLCDNTVIFIVRFSLKIISQIINISEDVRPKQNLLRNETCFNISLNFFLSTEDLFLMEYSSLILTHFCDEPRYCDKLLTNNLFIEILLHKIVVTTDADIFLHLLKILMKLLNDPTGLEKLCGQFEFPFEVFMGALRNEYVIIQQCVLSVLGHMSSCAVLEKYYNIMFLEEIFLILENYLWKDLHSSVLDLLKKVASRKKVAEHIIQNPFLLRLFNFYKTVEDYKLETIRVFVELARNRDALSILHEQGLCLLLLQNTVIIGNSDIAKGVSLMLHNTACTSEILDSSVISDFLQIIKNPNKDWSSRVGASETIMNLVKISKNACSTMVECSANTIFAFFFGIPLSETPAELLFNIIEIMRTISKHEELRNSFMSEYLASNLISSIEKPSSIGFELLIALINCISLYITEEIVQKLLLNSNIIKWIMYGLNNFKIRVKSAVNDFIILTSKIVEFCDKYITDGVLDYLLENKNSIIDCPNWSKAIDSILSNNLPVKFAVKRKLDFNDVTGDDFYCSKTIYKSFKILSEIMTCEVSPWHPIYLINFHRENMVEMETKENSDQSLASVDTSCPCYSRRPLDIFLPKYLRMVRDEIDTLGFQKKHPPPPDYFDMTDIAKRVEIIAKVVCAELKGHTSDSCLKHALNVHLHELKIALFCNIIPLGQLKIGGLFEKALLFKVLADQVGVPSTFEIGIDGVAVWNEVAIFSPPRHCFESQLVPKLYLNSSHLVDLMELPGKLYPIGSAQAYEYKTFVT